METSQTSVQGEAEVEGPFVGRMRKESQTSLCKWFFISTFISQDVHLLDQIAKLLLLRARTQKSRYCTFTKAPCLCWGTIRQTNLKEWFRVFQRRQGLAAEAHTTVAPTLPCVGGEGL